jgi:hypothetical protein
MVQATRHTSLCYLQERQRLIEPVSGVFPFAEWKTMKVELARQLAVFDPPMRLRAFI